MKSSEMSMSVAISKHEREGLSGTSTNSDSKRSRNRHPVSWRATRSTLPSARMGVSVSEERLERLGDTDSISNAAATTPAESAGGP